ncbi:hypothetical protein [Streptomyces sp. NPDC060205]|uniref:hypothetical protein n=1 Tax=Streptomyces sp. NPDC060205 TaxID=3347072 RepID=UPI003648931A
MPVRIDAALDGVTMKWNTSSTCEACNTSVIRWADDFDNAAGDSAYWDADDWNAYTDGRWGTRATTWNGTGKETIDLGWSVTASVDASSIPSVTADFGTSGIPEVQEFAPRCDDFVGGSLPGCVLPFFKPTYTVDTNKYPAAGGYYWYMQQVMPDHAGSKR